jgi:hypothetical protein
MRLVEKLNLDEKAGQEGGALCWLVFDPAHDGQEDGLLVHNVQLVSSFINKKNVVTLYWMRWS